jgi:hypothetical protein
MTDGIDEVAYRRKLEEIPMRKAQPESWPSHVRQLSIDEMDGMGVDQDANIYWHGKLIEVRKRVQLRTLELSLLAAATAGAVLQGIAAMFPFVPRAIERLLALGGG